jgi:hypothetical protein
MGRELCAALALLGSRDGGEISSRAAAGVGLLAIPAVLATPLTYDELSGRFFSASATLSQPFSWLRGCESQ